MGGETGTAPPKQGLVSLAAAVWGSNFTWGVISSAIVFYGFHLWTDEEQDEHRSDANGQLSLQVHMGQIKGAQPDEHDHVDFRMERLSFEDMEARSAALLEIMKTRRSVRFFSPDPVPEAAVRKCIEIAGTAPSGAHCQPWHFLLVSSNEHKQTIRELVEEQERINYEGAPAKAARMNSKWQQAVTPMVNKLHSSAGVSKPYLSEAPYIVVMMKESYAIGPDGERKEHYYPEQSVGIAAGMFLTALHTTGLVTLTSTPLGAEIGIRKALGRPANEKVYLLMPVGFPSADATVPYRKPGREHKDLDRLLTVYR